MNSQLLVVFVYVTAQIAIIGGIIIAKLSSIEKMLKQKEEKL